jgi:predicted amidohydrolase
MSGTQKCNCHLRVWLDLQGGVDKTIKIIKEAAAEGAKIIGFPEVFIPGRLFVFQKIDHLVDSLQDIPGRPG